MRSQWLVAGLLLATLAACRGQDVDTATAAQSAQPAAAPAAAAAEVATATSATSAPSAEPAAQAAAASTPPANQGGGLKATVSGLTGTVSDLQGLIRDLGGEVRGQQIHVDLPADTLFAFHSAQVVAAGEPNLDKLAQLINKTQGVVTLVGHTDSKGSDSYNQDLSQRRAQAVSTWLQTHGVAADRLQASGRGAAEPVAENTHADGSDNPQGRAKNRRVEAIIPAP